MSFALKRVASQKNCFLQIHGSAGSIHHLGVFQNLGPTMAYRNPMVFILKSHHFHDTFLVSSFGSFPNTSIQLLLRLHRMAAAKGAENRSPATVLTSVAELGWAVPSEEVLQKNQQRSTHCSGTSQQICHFFLEVDQKAIRIS